MVTKGVKMVKTVKMVKRLKMIKTVKYVKMAKMVKMVEMVKMVKIVGRESYCIWNLLEDGTKTEKGVIKGKETKIEKREKKGK